MVVQLSESLPLATRTTRRPTRSKPTPGTPSTVSRDLDFEQKLALRRVYRAFGFGTRTNVLVADVSESHSELTPKSYTDIDVLAVGLSADLRALYTVGYCTTSRASSERVFWLRGLREEFPGAEAIFVARDFSNAARSLCIRNGIAALTEVELAEYVGTSQRRLSPARRRFEETLEPGIEGYARFLRTLAKQFDPLVAYRDYVHLQLGHARNLQVAISTLRLPAEAWRGHDSRHLGLLLDVVFIYALALVDAARYVHRAARAHVPEAVRTFVGGGAAALRDKTNLTRLVGDLLTQLGEHGVQLPASAREAIRPVPTYTEDISALVGALLQQPEIVERLPWYIETLQLAAVLGFSDVAGQLHDAGEPPADSERALRMVREIVAFLVRQSGLPREHLEAFDRLLAPRRDTEASQTKLSIASSG